MNPTRFAASLVLAAAVSSLAAGCFHNDHDFHSDPRPEDRHDDHGGDHHDQHQADEHKQQ
jgi:hypothetical protein